ncbi:hypothetical protein V8B97DRAFT_2025444 [Scleroderma yunnanense]
MTLFAEAAPSNAYFHWLYQQQVIKVFAPISIWILEFFLTLADEVRLLNGSKKRWGITHVLYIPTRYFPLLGSLCATYSKPICVRLRELQKCVALYRTAEIILYFGMVSAEGLLLIRTLALWNTQSMVRMLLIWLYLVVAIIMFVCSVISSTLKFQGICGETSASVATALATQLSRVTVGMFSSAAFFELVIIFSTVLYGFRLRAQTGLHSTSKLITAVTQGNLVYALSLFVISVINITFFVLPLRDGWNGLFVTFQGTLHGVMASRILFGLQDAVSEGFSLQVFTQSGVLPQIFKWASH